MIDWQDASVLANMPDLMSVTLQENKIVDISVLGKLTNLSYTKELGALYLNQNQISDISVLENMTRLWCLHLEGNQITDVSPLGKMLEKKEDSYLELHLYDNPIKDYSPVESVSNLTK